MIDRNQDRKSILQVRTHMNCSYHNCVHAQATSMLASHAKEHQSSLTLHVNWRATFTGKKTIELL